MIRRLFRQKKSQESDTKSDKSEMTKAEVAKKNDSSQVVSQHILRSLNNQYLENIFQLEAGAQAPTGKIKGLAAEFDEQISNYDMGSLDLPRLPNVLPKLMSIMRNPNAGTQALVDLISSEPGLATSVLSLANGPFFRVAEKPIEDINRALVFLGADGLKRIVNTTLMQPILVLGNDAKQLSDILFRQVFMHADFAYLIASESEVSSDIAHLLALLGGGGNIAILAFYQKHCAALALTDQEKSWLVKYLFERHSNQLAYAIVKHWQVGEEIEAVLAFVSKADKADLDSALESKLGDLLITSRLVSYVRLLFDGGRLEEQDAHMLLKELRAPAHCLSVELASGT